VADFFEFSNAFNTACYDPGVGVIIFTGAAGMQQLAGDALLYRMSEEAQEGRDAFTEKRPPDFARFPRHPPRGSCSSWAVVPPIGGLLAHDHGSCP